ncbi:MAG: hypothetical protein ACRCTY_01900 [Candidatus Adiutrix sp.]
MKWVEEEQGTPNCGPLSWNAFVLLGGRDVEHKNAKRYHIFKAILNHCGYLLHIDREAVGDGHTRRAKNCYNPVVVSNMEQMRSCLASLQNSGNLEVCGQCVSRLYSNEDDDE